MVAPTIFEVCACVHKNTTPRIELDEPILRGVIF